MFGFLKRMISPKEEEWFTSVVVAAAGSSSRMQGENKLFASVGGVPVLARTVQALALSPLVDEIVIAVREEDLLTAADLCKSCQIGKPMKLITGGETRTHSVMAAVSECNPEATHIAVHDGARPLVTVEVIERAILAARRSHAAAPAVPVKDTIKVAVDGVVERTPDRSTLYAVQTPQVFDAALLTAALRSALDAEIPVTDDCSAVERLGKEIVLTEGSYENIKITTPEDLILAEAIWENRG